MTEEVKEFTPEEQRQAAEKAFSAETGGPVAEKVESPETPKPEAAPDEWEGVPPIVRRSLESISKQVSSISELGGHVKTWGGRIAAIQGQIDAAKAAAKAVPNAPTPAQITEASKSPEKWKSMKEEFPDIGDAIDERLAADRAEVLKQIPNIKPELETFSTEFSKSMAQVVAEAKAEARMLAAIDAKHEDWESTVKTPEFGQWMKAQAPEVQALAESLQARDAIRMLDLYSEHAKAEAAKAKQKERLEKAVPARGSGAPAHQTISEREAAEKEFAAQFA